MNKYNFFNSGVKFAATMTKRTDATTCGCTKRDATRHVSAHSFWGRTGVGVLILFLFVAITARAQTSIPGSNLTWGLASGTLTISGTGAMPDFYDGTAPWYSQKDAITTLVIANGVTSIGNHAFISCSKIASMTLPEGMTSIGVNAFIGCTGLSGSLTLPAGLKAIGVQAFYGCSGLTGNLTLPEGLTTIGESAFMETGFTGSLTLQEGLTDIGVSAFRACKFTGKLTLPDELKTIGVAAFMECTGFTGSLTLPAGLTSIGIYAFEKCRFSGSLTVPGGLTTIGECVFNGCTNFDGSLIVQEGISGIGVAAFGICGFTSISIPSSVGSVGDYAFYNNKRLTVFVNHATTPQTINANVFDEVNKATVTLRVPNETSVELYKATTATGWNNFGTILAIEAVINVTVTPANPHVQKGTTQEFVANVTAQGGASEAVTWKITGNVLPTTTISEDGLLTIDENETASTLTVTATSDFDGTKHGTATVTVTEEPVIPVVIEVTVSPDVVSVETGTTQLFVADVVTDGGASDAITWTVTGSVLPTTNISANGLLTVDADETATTLTVKATSDFDNTKYGTATVTVIPTTGVEIIAAPHACVYPNPTKGMVTLKFETDDVYHVTLSDMTGKILLRQTVANRIVQMDFSGYPLGAYLLTIDDGKRMSTTKVIRN